jgi:hypothetical protein
MHKSKKQQSFMDRGSRRFVEWPYLIVALVSTSLQLDWYCLTYHNCPLPSSRPRPAQRLVVGDCRSKSMGFMMRLNHTGEEGRSPDFLANEFLGPPLPFVLPLSPALDEQHLFGFIITSSVLMILFCRICLWSRPGGSSDSRRSAQHCLQGTLQPLPTLSGSCCQWSRSSLPSATSVTPWFSQGNKTLESLFI